MIKVEVVEKFTLKEFDKLKNITRRSIDEQGTLFVGDTFECDEEMAKYLMGNNALNKVVVKTIEVEPVEATETQEVQEISTEVEEVKEAETKKVEETSVSKKKNNKKK